MIIDEEVLRLLRLLSKRGGGTIQSLARRYGFLESRLPKIIEWLERYHLVRVVKVRRHTLIVKTRNLDDFLKRVEALKREVEEVLSSYKPEPKPKPEPVPNVLQIIMSMSRNEAVCLVGIKTLQSTIVAELCELTGLSWGEVFRAVRKLESKGLATIRPAGKMKLLELTGRGLYVAEKLEEMVKLIGPSFTQE